MDKPIYRVMKVFDSQWYPGMPKDVKEAFFDLFRDRCTGNDVYVEWTVHDDDSEYDPDNEWGAKKRLVDNWLIANGAEDRQEGKFNGETIIIKHWW
jgi:hypothetical protein